MKERILTNAILFIAASFLIEESFSSADSSAESSIDSPPLSSTPPSSLYLSCPVNQKSILLTRFGKGDSPHRFCKAIDELRASGSSQFSEQQIPQLLSELSKKNIKKEDLIIVDLREEPHGFADGRPFQWDMKGITCLRGKPLSDILSYESAALEAVKNQPSPHFYEIEKKEEGDIKKLKEITFSPQKIISEGDLLASYQIDYKRFPVTDHHRPTDERVEEFVAFVQGLPSDKWLHFHCHAGRGRTSTFLILYGIIKNPSLPLEVIIDQQVAQGSLDVRTFKERKKETATERWIFIQKFYKYANDAEYGLHAPAEKAKTWRQWIKDQEGMAQGKTR